jgi:hypothetical protein
MQLDPTLDAVNCGYITERYFFMRAHPANPTPSAAGLSGCAAPGLGDQVLYTFAKLCTDTGPIINTLQVQAKTFFLTFCHRVEKPDSFNTAPITFVTAISHNDVIEGFLFSATARQSNLYHSLKPFQKQFIGRDIPDGTGPNKATSTADTGHTIMLPLSRLHETAHFNRV